MCRGPPGTDWRAFEKCFLPLDYFGCLSLLLGGRGWARVEGLCGMEKQSLFRRHACEFFLDIHTHTYIDTDKHRYIQTNRQTDRHTYMNQLLDNNQRKKKQEDKQIRRERGNVKGKILQKYVFETCDTPRRGFKHSIK